MSVLSRLAGRGKGPGGSARSAERAGLVRWFHGRDRRERFLIVIGGAVVLCYVAVAWIWQPLSAMRAQALTDIAKYESIRARLAAAGPDLAFAAESAPLGSPATVITDSATAGGLVIRRLEPEGKRTRIELEDADFTVLIEWLALLEQDHSLRVATIELDRRPEPGMVSARISVEN